MYRDEGSLGRLCIEMCISSYMKRLNPNTNQPFKRGDTREDGFVFFNYTGKLKSNGFFQERWLSVEVSEKVKNKDKQKKRDLYKRKSERHAPGFNDLTAAQKATVHRLQSLNGEWIEYKDLTLETVAEDLVGYEIDAGPLLDAAIHHAGPLMFDAKEAFRLSLTL